ncbi:MAG TPA: hypothetical protein VF698_12535 [Thermoanaerobaculia bacterium]
MIASPLLERFLARRFPDLDLRVVIGNDRITVRYAVPLERGRRFPVLFELLRDGDAWRADRDIERGVIGETLELLAWRATAAM